MKNINRKQIKTLLVCFTHLFVISVCSCVQFVHVSLLNYKKQRLHHSSSSYLMGFCVISEAMLEVVEHQWETGTGHQGWSNLSIFCKLCIFKPRTSFKGVWDWIPGQVQSPVSYTVSSLCVCVCIPVCLNFRTIWWGRRDVTADRIKVRAYSGSTARKTMCMCVRFYVWLIGNRWIWGGVWKKFASVALILHLYCVSLFYFVLFF